MTSGGRQGSHLPVTPAFWRVPNQAVKWTSKAWHIAFQKMPLILSLCFPWEPAASLVAVIAFLLRWPQLSLLYLPWPHPVALLPQPQLMFLLIPSQHQWGEASCCHFSSEELSYR